MPSSGTYTYAPDIAEFTDEAWERCGKDPSKLGNDQLVSTRRSLNLLFSYWSTKGVNRYAVDEQTQALTINDPSYVPAVGTLMILHGLIRRGGIDTPVYRMSLENYHEIPDKTTTGLPTQIFHDQGGLMFYLWQVPENSTDVLRYWRLRRTQDVTAAAETPDVQYQWYEALASGLAEKLSLKFAPDKHAMLKAEAKESFDLAQMATREVCDTRFTMR